MRSKRSLMGFSALLILLYHLYIPVTGSVIEQFIYGSSYIGVDIFFFLSAYSIGNASGSDYKSFLKNRFIRIYIPFIIFAGVSCLIKKLSILRFLQIISGIEFFIKGGGAFLWFITAIMLLYILSPFFKYLKKRFGMRSMIIVFAVWLLIAVICQFIFNYKRIFILVNRLPIFFIGFYFKDISDSINRAVEKKKLPAGFIPIVAVITAALCCVPVYYFGTGHRLNIPFTDSYYITAIPLTISIIVLFELFNKNKKDPILPFFGSMSLELYIMQMVFGYSIEAAVLRALKLPLLSFLITASLVVLMAFSFNKLYLFIISKFSRRC